MSFVVDASTVGSWLLPDEEHPEALAALERLQHEDALVPKLFWFEIRNLFLTNERRKRITPAQTATALSSLQLLSLEVDDQADSDITLQLARSHRLTVYDATYLELVVRRGLSLLTLDKQLATAAKRLGQSGLVSR